MSQAAPDDARAALRRELEAKSKEEWKSYWDKLRSDGRVLDRAANLSENTDLEDTNRVVHFQDVDPTKVYEWMSGYHYLILPGPGAQVMGVRLDDNWHALIAALREARLELGYRDEGNLEMAGQLTGAHPLPNTWLGGESDTVWRPVAQAQGIYAPGQLAVFYEPGKGPQIPGYAGVEAKLAEARQAGGALKADKPEELLQSLLQSLRATDVHLFGRLWTDGEDEQRIRRRFEQFQKAFETSRGNIAFDKVEEPRTPPGAEEEMKMLVVRTDPGAKPSTKPFTIVKRAEGWRFKRGSL